MTAIIPAAGRGTRMAEITQGRPKELLRLGRRTVLARVIEEAQEAGADRVVVVSSPEKPTLTEHALELGAEVAIQAQMRGFGHAIAAAGVEEDAIILLPDGVFAGPAPSQRMANLLLMGVDGAIAVESVSDEEVSLYGIVEVDEGSGAIRSLVEKPQPSETESRWAIASRYALARPLMAELGRWVAAMEPVTPSELGMTPFLQHLVDMGVDIKAVALQPGTERFDCGDPDGYRAAFGRPW